MSKEKLMQLLGCTEEEALEIIEQDKAVDKMSVSECESDLTQEQKASAKKYRQVGGKVPTVYKLDKRERKADDDKRKLVELIASAIGMVADDTPTVENQERQIDFVFNGRKFRVVLSAPRS